MIFIGYGAYYERVRYLIDDVFMLVRRKVFEDTKGYNPDFFLQFEEFASARSNELLVCQLGHGKLKVILLSGP